MSKAGGTPFYDYEVDIIRPFLDKVVVCLILGPSGVGKGTAIGSLIIRPSFSQLVRYTTRPQWPEDQEGYQYHFITQAKFDEMILQSEFLEWRSYGSSYYGTSRSKFISAFCQEGTLLVDMNLHMALDLKRVCVDAGIKCVDILISPGDPALLHTEKGIEKSLTILRDRIRHRNRGEGSEEIEARIRLARRFLLEADKISHHIGSIDGHQDQVVSEIATIASKALMQK